MERFSDIVIIGAGPAGMTAAIYGSRAGLSVLMLEAGAPGGKLTKTYEIENWPGVQLAHGRDLAMDMFNHSTHFGAEYVYGNVAKIEYGKAEGEPHRIVCEDGSVYVAKTIIIASGTLERLLGVPGEKENTGRGVSYCAICDGAFFKNKDVAVIGGGNSALEEAMYLAEFVNKVYIVIRRDVFRADRNVIEKVENHPKMEIIREHTVQQIIDDGMKVVSVELKGKAGLQTIPVSAVFPYIGAIPSTSFLDESIKDQAGYIIVDQHMQTAVKGIFAAGDVIQKDLRQVVTATNDGAIAAQSAIQYIHSL